MRRVYLLPLAAVAAVGLYSCSQQSVRPVVSDLARFDVEGDVASMKLVSYKPEPVSGVRGSNVDPAGFNYYVEFNEAGMLVLNESYNTAGKPVSREENVYDSQNRITEKKVYKKLSPNDEAPVLAERSVYRYRRGALAEVKVYDGKDSLTKRDVYEELGNGKVKVMQYNALDTLRGIRQIIYDAAGHEIENLSMTRKGDTLSIFNFVYDEQGRMMEMRSDNFLFGKINNTIEYGEDGMRRSVTMAGERGSLVSDFEYELDGNGNWTVRRSLRAAELTGQDSLVRVDRREIVYR